MTLRIVSFIRILETYLPNLATFLLDKGLDAVSKSAFTARPEWRLDPAPSLKHCLPVITDTLVLMLETGATVRYGRSTG